MTEIAELKPWSRSQCCRHFSAPTTSTPVTSSSETSTPFPTRIVFPLEPLRTTTPMPTSINPLLRFYPQEGASKEDEADDENDKLEDGYYWDETRTKKVGKHNTRSSPMSDRWMKDGMSTAASRYTNKLNISQIMNSRFSIPSISSLRQVPQLSRL